MKSLLYITLFALPFLLTLLNIQLQKKSVSRNYFLNTLLVYFLFFQVGIQAICTGLIQIFWGEGECRSMDRCWSPYLMEVGMMNLSFGVGGIMTYWLRGSFWVAIGGGYALYLILSVIAYSVEVLVVKGEGLFSMRLKAVLDLASAFILFYLIFRRPAEKGGLGK
ncbi:DUF6790 family protein [Estrella lausannensis]|uniref:Putative membrane protein n=1 Tax=Estrella lausannensis TaxID=483423 RepID=A0A0H5DPV0_9BACT|nr:DUF6790 family protein [Estrella lausannensis]CRX38507.1 putative membrane protein [Estrella lausannensis]